MMAVYGTVTACHGYLEGWKGEKWNHSCEVKHWQCGIDDRAAGGRPRSAGRDRRTRRAGLARPDRLTPPRRPTMDATMTHTPEPWRVETDGTMTGRGPVIRAGRLDDKINERDVAVLETAEVSGGHRNGYKWFRLPDAEEIEANAARIVACVNAMIGIDQPEMFVDLANDALDRVESQRLAANMMARAHAAELAALRAERDALRRILDEVFRRWTFDDGQRHTHTWHDREDCAAPYHDLKQT